MGNCVNKPEDITSILKDKNFSAINLGYAGNGPLLKYATLKEYFPKNTKNVLWFFYEMIYKILITKKKQNLEQIFKR